MCFLQAFSKLQNFIVGVDLRECTGPDILSNTDMSLPLEIVKKSGVRSVWGRGDERVR